MLKPTAKRFIDTYSTRLITLGRIAELARDEIQEILDPLNLDLHVISSRPKSFHSALQKIRRKDYGAPGRQLTDQIGVRVITYYQDDVDVVTKELERELRVDHRRSVDKRQELGIQQFGYRSVHLIARMHSKRFQQPCFKDLYGKVIEIQIRSILEHAWAEIEHEINYKSEVDFPQPTLRRFSAVAGTLEILEGQFLVLRKEKVRLVQGYKEQYAQGRLTRDEFDAARLLGYLLARFPNGIPMLSEERDAQFSPRMEVVCLEALRSAGVRRAITFDNTSRKKKFTDLVNRFAGAVGIAAREVSHFALCTIAVSIRKPKLLDEYPELLNDTLLCRIIGHPDKTR